MEGFRRAGHIGMCICCVHMLCVCVHPCLLQQVRGGVEDNWLYINTHSRLLLRLVHQDRCSADGEV